MNKKEKRKTVAVSHLKRKKGNGGKDFEADEGGREGHRLGIPTRGKSGEKFASRQLTTSFWDDNDARDAGRPKKRRRKNENQNDPRSNKKGHRLASRRIKEGTIQGAEMKTGVKREIVLLKKEEKKFRREHRRGQKKRQDHRIKLGAERGTGGEGEQSGRKLKHAEVFPSWERSGPGGKPGPKELLIRTRKSRKKKRSASLQVHGRTEKREDYSIISRKRVARRRSASFLRGQKKKVKDLRTKGQARNQRARVSHDRKGRHGGRERKLLGNDQGTPKKSNG